MTKLLECEILPFNQPYTCPGDQLNQSANNSYNTKHQLKSSLALLSQNLSYFERQGRKIVAVKKQQSKQKINKPISSNSTKRELSKQLTNQYTSKDLKLSQKIDRTRELKHLHTRFRSDGSRKYLTQRSPRQSASFFKSQPSVEIPSITITKIKPIVNQSFHLKRLQQTRQRSKRLLSLNILRKNKQGLSMLKLKNVSQQYETQKQLETIKSKTLLKSKQSKTFYKWSQPLIKTKKFKPISFSIDRRLSQQYESSIKKTIGILNRCHDILTTLDLKQ